MSQTLHGIFKEFYGVNLTLKNGKPFIPEWGKATPDKKKELLAWLEKNQDYVKEKLQKEGVR